MTDQPKKPNVSAASIALPNHRRELFAQLLVQGFTEVEAYEKAGYKRHDGNACTLAKHPEVQVRLEEIRGDLAANPLNRTFRSGVTAESLLEEAEAVRVQAMESGQLNAAVAAIKEKGVLSGKRVERSEVGGPGEFDHLSDEELRAEIERECRRLGYIIDGSEPQH
jgi:hypothetical protein